MKYAQEEKHWLPAAPWCCLVDECEKTVKFALKTTDGAVYRFLLSSDSVQMIANLFLRSATLIDGTQPESKADASEDEQ